ncbi:hypothetical protein HMI54_000380 [Coelomomyces lativittatus]|nr:hypothetical protein HMI54_000380 [Coelomomyces lativittatus]
MERTDLNTFLTDVPQLTENPNHPKNENNHLNVKDHELNATCHPKTEEEEEEEEEEKKQQDHDYFSLDHQEGIKKIEEDEEIKNIDSSLLLLPCLPTLSTWSHPLPTTLQHSMTCLRIALKNPVYYWRLYDQQIHLSTSTFSSNPSSFPHYTQPTYASKQKKKKKVVEDPPKDVHPLPSPDPLNLNPSIANIHTVPMLTQVSWLSNGRATSHPSLPLPRQESTSLLSNPSPMSIHGSPTSSHASLTGGPAPPPSHSSSILDLSTEKQKKEKRKEQKTKLKLKIKAQAVEKEMERVKEKEMMKKINKELMKAKKKEKKKRQGKEKEKGKHHGPDEEFMVSTEEMEKGKSTASSEPQLSEVQTMTTSKFPLSPSTLYHLPQVQKANKIIQKPIFRSKLTKIKDLQESLLHPSPSKPLPSLVPSSSFDFHSFSLSHSKKKNIHSPEWMDTIPNKEGSSKKPIKERKRSGFKQAEALYSETKQWADEDGMNVERALLNQVHYKLRLLQEYISYANLCVSLSISRQVVHFNDPFCFLNSSTSFFSFYNEVKTSFKIQKISHSSFLTLLNSK